MVTPRSKDAALDWLIWGVVILVLSVGSFGGFAYWMYAERDARNKLHSWVRPNAEFVSSETYVRRSHTYHIFSFRIVVGGRELVVKADSVPEEVWQRVQGSMGDARGWPVYMNPVDPEDVCLGPKEMADYYGAKKPGSLWGGGFFFLVGAGCLSVGMWRRRSRC